MTVDADIPSSTDLLGKSVDDLQEDVVISGGVVSGTLKYVTGYTGFSGDTDEQEGNYLAIHVEDSDATSIGIRKLGSAEDPKAFDSDGIAVIRMKDGVKGFEIVSVVDGTTFVNRFSYDLTLEPEEE